MRLEDGTGTGKQAKIDDQNRLFVKAVVVEQQHHISVYAQEAYQVSADIPIAASEKNLLLIKNTHDTKNMIITFMRVETIGAATAGTAAYFNIKTGGTYTSGGTATVPTNMNVGSSVAAQGTFIDARGSAIVTGGTFTQIDRTYQNSTKYEKHGSIVLPKNSSLMISHKGSTAAGQAYCRVSFYYEEN